MQPYPDSLAAMLHHGWRFFVHLLGVYTSSIGNNILGWFAPGIVAVLAVGFQLSQRIRKDGFAAVKARLSETVIEMSKPYGKAFIVVYGVIFCSVVISALWQDHRLLVLDRLKLKSDNGEFQKRLTTAASVIEHKRHFIDRDDPVFSDTTHMLMAFASFRSFVRTPTGQPNCEVKITAPKETQEFAMVFASLSNAASGCYTFGPIDAGMDPDEDRTAVTGMIDNKIVFHMSRDDKAAIGLFHNLSGLIQSQPSYELPPHKFDHFVWLQFGRTIVWNSQLQ